MGSEEMADDQMKMIKVICAGCSRQVETPHPDETTDYAVCPQCGDGRIWKDNEETRRILKVANGKGLCQSILCQQSMVHRVTGRVRSLQQDVITTDWVRVGARRRQ